MTRPTFIAIHLVLVLLIGAPLHYYIANSDARDERFAWRMFSPIRSEKCGTVFLLGPQKHPLKASQFFHSAWVGLAQRGRRQVIGAMGKRLCETHPGQELRIRIQCETSPGATADDRSVLFRAGSHSGTEVIAPGLFDFCETGTL